MNVIHSTNEEKQRLTSLLFSCNILGTRMQMLEPVIENTAWMKVKLDEARELIKNSNVVIQYDNGGGQKGLRENPLFKGYEALWKSYMAGMNKIMEALPDEAKRTEIEKTEETKTVLQLVRAKHKGSA